ncbi:CRISPR-associated endonuclease Cas1 [Iningainema tapete]|uniref:CRISPR-associated endonuclease Cas1 n=1 Tax=Iningainema tapete BLCC-T55 TaxID=2748662 RepID=A0A8J6XC12_9CYAN|nr:CRISPR-associated endonuclease Cas1 [Iningainema tapete]MBD2772625.1 CRISPR-associated endonuclease Cas1 [Iningainema tapete BLCC-T55]
MTTIYVTEPDSHLQIKNHQLLVFHQHKLDYQLPVNQVKQIILFGSSHIEREVSSLAIFRRIPILMLDKNGEYMGCYYHLSKRQPKQFKRHFDDEFTFATAQSMIRAKLHNSCIVLQQLTSKYAAVVAKSVFSMISLQTALDVMKLLIDDLSMATSVAELREYEIMAATLYYPALGSFLPKEFDFQQRRQQSPTDSINTLMNLGYTLLGQTIYNTMLQFGLHTDFSHLDHFCTHNSPMVCDFMAEFRSPLVDELVANLVISQTLTPNDFTLPDTISGGYLYPKVLKIFLKHWEEKLDTQIIHPYAGKVSYRRALELQVQEYIACLHSDVKFYRPMLLPLNTPSLVVHTTDKQKTEQLMLVKR